MFAAIMSGCFGKTGYLSWSAANKALRRGRRKMKDRRGSGGTMTIYRCRYCAHWHIGRAA